MSETARPKAVKLTTEYLEDPIGIDSPDPRVSWWFVQEGRGASQSAYQIQVAASADALVRGKKIWDSKRVKSSESVNIALKGLKLSSGKTFYWRVRVWDALGIVSEWSDTAKFEMGLLKKSDWKGKWISIPEVGNGYHSATTSVAEDAKWVMVDLERSCNITRVRLVPARPFNWNEDIPGFGFPVRYRLESSQDASFAEPVLLADRSAADQPNPGGGSVEIDFPVVSARFVRITALTLYTRMDGQKLFALAGLSVIDENGENVAAGKQVLALDAIDSPGWSPDLLTSGRAGSSEGAASPLFRKEFSLEKKPVKARAYVCGLGYCELYLNGEKVGDRVLDPSYTNFNKRVLYSSYDVTGLLKKGRNAVGAMLGKGWFGQSQRLILQLNIEYKDGSVESIVTDKSWKRSTGPILESSLYHGETYDARLEQPGWNLPGFKDSGWQSVVIAQPPAPLLTSQTIQPIRRIRELKHKSLKGVGEHQWVFDYGQNLSGWGRLQVSGPPGQVITLKFAENIYPDGTVNQENLRSARATETYITKGGCTEVYEPHFTYHGFRYIQLEGFPGQPAGWEVMGACEVHTDLPETGTFSCSNELINQIHSNSRWGFKTNFHSIPTDCPQRDERQGWMGDAHMTADMGFYNFNMAAAYTKFLQDIADAQGDDGRIPDTVPHIWGTNPGDPMWAAAYHIIAWDMYRHTGDRRMLENHYEGLRKYVDLLAAEAPEYILERNNYGDWVGIVETPKNLISTGSFYLVSKIVSRIAGILGKKKDRKRYEDLCSRIADAFNARFFNPETGVYGNGSQYSYVWPLYLGIVPESSRTKVVQNLADDILMNHKGHLSTGFLGARYLFEVLCNEGRSDVAYTVITQKDYPSYGYMIEKGATTVWELWQYETGPGMNSHNHPALGFISGWFYRDIAGIRPSWKSAGYERFCIKPYLMGDLNEAGATLDSIRGKISSHWIKNDGKLTLSVTIPPNTKAAVWMPKNGQESPSIYESGALIWRNGEFVRGGAGIDSAIDSGEWVRFEVCSGDFCFELG